MKFIRVAAEVEAMARRDQDGNILDYLVDFLDGKQTRILTVDELTELGFRKANGNEIGKERKPRRKKGGVGISAVTNFIVTGKESELEAGVEVEQEPDATAFGTSLDHSE